MTKVEMRPAYEWICEDCGKSNFESCIVAEMSDGERLEQVKRMGLVDEFQTEMPEELQGDFVTYPDNVTCGHCGTVFETQSMHESDEDE